MAYLLPVLAKSNFGKIFFAFFGFLYYFFFNFLARVGYEQNSGQKFFSLFLSQSDPVLAKNNAGKRFFNFLNVFAIFFIIFFPRPSKNEYWDKFFFFSLFRPIYYPFWLKVISERDFLIFYTIFFWNFLALVGYEQNSGLKFFSLFLGHLIPFWLKIMPERGFFYFFKFFAIFFGIFFPRL